MAVGVLAALVLAGCGGPTEPTQDPAALGITSATLPSGVEGTAYSTQLAATGGAGGYSWSIASGTLPTGLTLDSSSGAIAGTPTVIGTTNFTVLVASGDGQTDTRSLSIAVRAVLAVATNTLPDGLRAAAYDQVLTATGGDGTYSWSVVTGSLPAGLGLTAANGHIAGTPTAAGSTVFAVRVQSGDGQTAEADISLTILDVLDVATSTLPSGVVGSPYSAQQLIAVGGVGPYAWSLSAGALPAGMSLSSTSGEIAGTPTSAESATFTVQVESGDGQTATKELSLDVYVELEITTVSLPDGTSGIAYDQSLAAVGGDGTYEWSVTMGDLPAGLSLDPATGRITGTPPSGAIAAVTIQVASGDGQIATVELTVTIIGPLSVVTTSLPSGVEGAIYSQSLAATGGDGDYTWSLAADTLPTGLGLSATGNVTGTAMKVGTATFTVQVDSGDGQTVQASLSISVYPVLAVTTSSLPGAVQGIAYDESVAATGGDGSYTWSVSAGALPAGLTIGASTGAVSGTPTTVESASFTLSVESGDGQVADAALSIDVAYLVLTPSELCSDNPPTAVISFASANLNTAIRQQLGLSPQTKLTCALAATVTNVTAGSIGIADLTGMQNLTGLTSAYLVDNSISDLGPLASLTQVGGLNLASNNLSDLGPLAGMTAMATLFLQHNNISDLSPLSGLPMLSQLELEDNSLTDISALSAVTSLQTLGLLNNTISDVSPLAGLTGLSFLMLGGNAISDISDLAGLTNLTWLNIWNNSVSDVSAVAGMTKLNYLNLTLNPVSDISALSGLTALKELVSTNGNITDISALSGLVGLERLFLATNDITDISALSGLTALTQVALDSNASLADIQALIDNSGLGVGDIVYLRTVEVPCSAIASLEAKGVQVYSDCLTPYQFCNGNPYGIVSFEDAALEDAVRAALALGPSDLLRCSATWTLTTFDASSLGITSLAGLQNASGLKQLTLSDNAITDISWLLQMLGLEQILLNQNDLTDVSPLSAMYGLTTVRLDDNTSLSDIQPLIDNPGIGGGDTVNLTNTAVSCTDVATLRDSGATVTAPTCP